MFVSHSVFFSVSVVSLLRVAGLDARGKALLTVEGRDLARNTRECHRTVVVVDHHLMVRIYIKHYLMVRPYIKHHLTCRTFAVDGYLSSQTVAEEQISATTNMNHRPRGTVENDVE